MTRAVLPVSVVIGSRNRAALLADTIASICAGNTLPAEIVVADQSDGAKPAPLPVAPPVRLRYLRLTSPGVSAARNAGAAAADQRVLVFTDDDMRAAPGWLEAIAAPILNDSVATAVSGRVIAGPPETTGGFVPALAESKERASYRGRLSKDVLAGGNMAIDRHAFLSIGGFDERLGPGRPFPAAEDNDLGFRLLEAGFQIVHEPAAVLEHRAWRPANEYLPIRFSYGRGKGAFYLKHTRAGDLHMSRRLGKDLLRRAWRTLRLAHHPRLAAGEVAYAAGVLRGAAEWLLTGGRTQESQASTQESQASTHESSVLERSHARR
jgi:GT2 family glycosyltransferase